MFQKVVLSNLQINGFRNHTEKYLEFGSGINLIYGANGTGKTNILDAIHYLCLTKSFLSFSDSLNIHYDMDFFSIKGFFLLKEQNLEILCALEKDKKKVFKKNKKEYQTLSEHIGLIPCVVISPSDYSVIYEGSENRRKFIDNIISQQNKDYLNALITYNRLVKQRNAALKTYFSKPAQADELIDIIDYQIAKEGEQIFKIRLNFIEQFEEIAKSIYNEISGKSETLNIIYANTFTQENFLSELKSNLSKDIQKGYTGIGIHKDDIKINLNHKSLKNHASQGQTKSALISLKLANYIFLRNELNKTPLLLIDDFKDRLDESRTSNLINFLKKNIDGQIIITDTNSNHFEKLTSKSSESGSDRIIQMV